MNGTMTSYQAIRQGGVRTYGELARVARPSSSFGTCCACHKWGIPTWQLSTRASICGACCERKGNEVLGTIARAERKARGYAKLIVARGEKPGDTLNLKFYASLAGVSEDFMRSALDQAKRAAS